MTIDVLSLDTKIKLYQENLQQVLNQLSQAEKQIENLTARRFGFIGAIETLVDLKKGLEEKKEEIKEDK